MRSCRRSDCLAGNAGPIGPRFRRKPRRSHVAAGTCRDDAAIAAGTPDITIKIAQPRVQALPPPHRKRGRARRLRFSKSVSHSFRLRQQDKAAPCVGDAEISAQGGDQRDLPAA
jgi:hypothetical protein